VAPWDRDAALARLGRLQVCGTAEAEFCATAAAVVLHIGFLPELPGGSKLTLK